MSACTHCGNTGWSTVPHPLYVDDGFFKPHHTNAVGKPVFYTAAVSCICHAGTKVRTAMEKREVPKYKMPLSLEEYRSKVFHDPQSLLDEIWPIDRKWWPAGPLFTKADIERVAGHFKERPVPL